MAKVSGIDLGTTTSVTASQPCWNTPKAVA
jgi:hypothetical protein